jgi:hypothetical protein
VDYQNIVEREEKLHLSGFDLGWTGIYEVLNSGKAPSWVRD